MEPTVASATISVRHSRYLDSLYEPLSRRALGCAARLLSPYMECACPYDCLAMNVLSLQVRLTGRYASPRLPYVGWILSLPLMAS